MIGHTSIRRELEGALPTVSLFVGPRSVGMWTLAKYLAAHHKYSVRNQSLVECEHLTAETIDSVVRLAQLSHRRLFILGLDRATDDILSALLKTLEESAATSYNKFILVAHDRAPATVESRARVYRFGLLTDLEVEQVLLRAGWDPDSARRYAPRGKGQVGAAMTTATAEWLDTKTTVRAAVSGILTRDTDVLDRLADRWTDDHTDLLGDMCREAMTQRWGKFTEDECAGLTRRLALRILFALRMNIRPRLLVRASLMSVLRSLP